MANKLLDDSKLNYLWGKITSVFAKKTELPTTLPANGGNADTVDNYHIVVSSSAPTNNNQNTITIVV